MNSDVQARGWQTRCSLILGIVSIIYYANKYTADKFAMPQFWPYAVWYGFGRRDCCARFGGVNYAVPMAAEKCFICGNRFRAEGSRVLLYVFACIKGSGGQPESPAVYILCYFIKVAPVLKKYTFALYRAAQNKAPV